MEPFFNLRIPTAPVYELPLFFLFLSLLFNAGVRIWVLSSSALNVSQRICIVILSAQNLRERKRASVLCFRRTMIIFPSSHSHTLYATVYSSASIRPGLVSYRVSRAMRPSLIAAGRLFPSRERALCAVCPRVHGSEIYYSELKGRVHSQKRIHWIRF